MQLDVEEKNTELHAVLNQLSVLQQLHDKLTDTLEQTRQDAAIAQNVALETIEKHRLDVVSLQTQLNDETQRADLATCQIETIEKANLCIQSELEEARKNEMSVSDELHDVKAQMIKQERLMLTERDTMKATIQQHLTNIEQLEKQDQNGQVEIARINNELSASMSEIDDLKRRLKMKMELIAKLQDSIQLEAEKADHLNNRLEIEAGTTAKLQEQLRIEQDRIAAFEVRISVETNAATLLREKLQAETNALNLLKEELLTEREQSAKMKTQLQTLDAKAIQLVELEQKYEALNDQYTKMITRHTSDEKEHETQVGRP
ncbi:hypothetical protein BDF19DRAFT_315347 [Syncephalis fuscata]|nr:hypothetical protein BDF19DRAFT_315347 [Syncephalis fuscata]